MVVVSFQRMRDSCTDPEEGWEGRSRVDIQFRATIIRLLGTVGGNWYNTARIKASSGNTAMRLAAGHFVQGYTG